MARGAFVSDTSAPGQGGGWASATSVAQKAKGSVCAHE